MGRRTTGRGTTGRRWGRTDRRTFLRIAGSGAVATALAGCSDGAEPTDSDADSSGNGTDDDESADDETPAGGAALKIGHLAPREVPMGVGSQRSAEVAVAELNEEGGVLDSRVTLVSEGTERDPARALAAAERLVHEAEVDVIVGANTAEVAYGIVDIVAENDVPYLLTGTESTLILEETVGEEYDRYRNVFRTGPINVHFKSEVMGDYAAFLADTHGWSRFAHISEAAPWTIPLHDQFADEIEARGLDVVYEGTVARNTDDYAPMFDDIEAEAPDALFQFANTAGQGQLLRSWATNRYSFALEGIHYASMVPEYWELTDGACRYVTTGQTGGGGLVELTDRTLDFVEAYGESSDDTSPSKPMETGFSTYDAIHFYARAVTDAGTLDYRTDLDAIVDAMLSLEYEGAAGEISLYGESEAYPHDVRPMRDGTGQITNYPVLQWRQHETGGGRECVFPRRHATASHVTPPWL